MSNDYNDDTIQYVEHQSYFSRLGNSLHGMCFGPILFVVSIALLVWNEGNAVGQHRALSEATGLTVSLDTTETIDSMYDGQLVHLVGRAETDDVLQDETFGIYPVNDDGTYALKLMRAVEMYQWVEHKSSETKKNKGGSSTTTTTYRYDKKWSSDVVDSTYFEDSSNHQNPNYMEYQTEYWTANPITLGAYTMSYDLVSRMEWYTSFSPSNIAVDSIEDADIQQQAQIYNHGFFIGQGSPSSPRVGDLRVSFSIVGPQTVSVVAEQENDGELVGYTTKNGREVLLLRQGTHTSTEIFRAAQTETTAMAWLIRAIGTLIMFVGLKVLAGPLEVLADVWPFFGDLVGGITSCVLGILAMTLSLTVIALAWVAHRPLVAIPLLLALAAGVHCAYRRARQESDGKFVYRCQAQQPPMQYPVQWTPSQQQQQPSAQPVSIPLAQVVDFGSNTQQQEKNMHPLPPPLQHNYRAHSENL